MVRNQSREGFFSKVAFEIVGGRPAMSEGCIQQIGWNSTA